LGEGAFQRRVGEPDDGAGDGAAVRRQDDPPDLRQRRQLQIEAGSLGPEIHRPLHHPVAESRLDRPGAGPQIGETEGPVRLDPRAVYVVLPARVDEHFGKLLRPDAQNAAGEIAALFWLARKT
jgi:hypothetical protein